MPTSPSLAINGGSPQISSSFNRFSTIGPEEIHAVTQVLESGVLSKFLGCWDPDFFGGPKVQEFEAACRKYFDVKHAIVVNSWTSGLIAAVGSLDIEPGDEVIVSPWTMCATATAILHWNAIPVFCDISPDTYNIDPEKLENLVTPRTKAVMAVDIFGQSCDIAEIRKVTDKYNLKLLTDSAQAPGVSYNGSTTGTLADIGGFSLNYHKHIHTGEGGIIVTNDDNLAQRAQLIRNHGEAVVHDMGLHQINNILGYNFRMGEIEAAIGIEQLKKLDRIVALRQSQAYRIIDGIKDLPGLLTPTLKNDRTHAFYILPLQLDLSIVQQSRSSIFEALTAEGIPGLIQGYTNIHTLPVFQRLTAYGNSGFPWSLLDESQIPDYSLGSCPIAEYLHNETFIGLEICLFDFSDTDIDSIIKAFHKVWNFLS